MPLTFVQLRDDIEEALEDSSNVLYTAATLDTKMEEVLRDLSLRRPLMQTLTFEFETRTGSTSTTTSGALVDSGEAQFRASDVGKVVYNDSTDDYAIVTAFVSTSQLTISSDIFTTTGDRYDMFNENCRHYRELFIGDVLDGVGADSGVRHVFYPLRRNPTRERSYTDLGDGRLDIDIGFRPDDSSIAHANLKVDVTFARRHQVSQLTDLAGALSAGASAGDTSIAVDGFNGSEVVAEDQEFTVAGLRGKYRVTDTGGVTLSTGAGTLTIFPALESDVANNDVVTMLGSSLTRDLERHFVHLVAAEAQISVATRFLRYADEGATEIAQGVTTLDTARALINTVTVGGPNVPGQYAAQVTTELGTADAYMEQARTVASAFIRSGERKRDAIYTALESGTPPKTTRKFTRLP